MATATTTQPKTNSTAPTTPAKPVKTAAQIEQEKSKRLQEKSERFVELASARTRNILNQLRILGNCSSPNYHYTEEQLEKVFGTIIDEVNKTRALFQPKAVSKKRDFSL